MPCRSDIALALPDLDAATGLTRAALAAVVRRLRRTEPRRGRPWAHPLARRIVVACTALRTNLTVRELAVVFAISKSQAHRIVANLTPRLAAHLDRTAVRNSHAAWILDGTLVPTRDHATAAKAKNYRWSCNLQVLARHADLQVIAIAGGGPGNRNAPVHDRGTAIEALCRRHRRVLADGGFRGIPALTTPAFRGNRILRDATWRRHRRRRARIEHTIARLKDWRVLRDHRRRGHNLLATARAVAFLHNLRIQLRDSS